MENEPATSVDWRRDGTIAVITVDHPPVNALNNAVRRGLIDAFTHAQRDAAIEAVVLTGAGRTYIAGADITEFDRPPQVPSTSDVIAAIEQVSKPIVAALHGTPLGGGFEIALACQFRIAAPGTRMGLPEIKLGLIPGAGGTQRLPRLIGMERAMAMILSGETIAADEALALGLIDAIVEGDLVAQALAFARRMLAEKRAPARARDCDERLAPLRAEPQKFDEMAAAHLKRARGLKAPACAVEALRGAIALPFDAAVEREWAMFLDLRAGDQSKAQRHVFFAERDAAKIPDLPKDRRAVESAAVIGAGTMGSGIAMCFANAGIPVTVVEMSTEALKRGLDAAEKNFRATAARGGLSASDVDRRLGLIKGTTDIEAIGAADIIVEAAFEDMAVKQELFARLDRLAKPEAVLATNTSYLDVDAIARSTARPQSVLGMHFFSPANVMRLLEVVRGAQTAPATLAAAMAVGRRIGKIPVVVGVCHGFVGNRMLRVRTAAAERLLLEGALPQDVDAALTKFGFPMGPFAMADLAGLDISWRMRKAQGLRAEIADSLCEIGRFGQKTRKGFYLYGEGSRTPQPDPEVEQLIVAASARLGVARQPIDPAGIVDRLIFPMINEGARILDEGIAHRPGDIDVIWIYGYGFPAWRGGPMFYADSVGLSGICERLRAWAATTGEQRYEPAPLLARLAAQNRGFGSLADAAR
ncbi:MAG TPA: 3-hydroxyacyl-CoA dehydrogenase NAD-binding domain-containing protein [Xanthobacteraceae bacterium]|nr:3-hydroxyacyl-CoA dehydrogenase NAD-binding domain-containing protein [Xanthobacteraceae bacterium]